MTVKDTVETVQAIITTAAIIIGGIWTYNLFVKERQQFPHANIEQKISHVALSKQTNLLRVGIEIANTGSSRLLLGKSIIRVQQILPIPPCPKQGPCASQQVNAAIKESERQADRFSWPLIAEREKGFEQPLDIEPGEKAPIEFEFVVPSDVKVIRVYSYFRNDQKSNGDNEIGWSMSSHYDFRTSREVRVK
jgi:hypothetical protein